MAVLMATPKEEERAAREQARRLAKLQKGKQKAAEKAAKQTRATIIRDELAKDRARRCRCGIRATMTAKDLTDLGAGCTAGMYVCPTLDAIRRRIDK